MLAPRITQRLREATARRAVVEYARLRPMVLEHEAIISASWLAAATMSSGARSAKTQRPSQASKRKAAGRPPQGQRMEWNRERVGDFALRHPELTWQQVADHFDLGKDYCQQLWAKYRAAHNLGPAVRKRSPSAHWPTVLR